MWTSTLCPNSSFSPPSLARSSPPSLPRAGPPDSGIAMSCNPQASISHLRDALSSLDTQIASLLSQRQELELHLQQADSLLVSSLMLVSRYWRDVVVNTPERMLRHVLQALGKERVMAWWIWPSSLGIQKDLQIQGSALQSFNVI
ncbi:hypothetical protein L210DRAFT_2996037 [Boletus edulis BED1]|uniref:F-box domain-containing protein n=1 Tax=Boletus edulis BED1 TaxID=1328754 RepID=A0AAD4BIL6_BOLED|nr:hypothetical protein L210DRAFT_2996037 [Boletus edulis BED1]